MTWLIVRVPVLLDGSRTNIQSFNRGKAARIPLTPFKHIFQLRVTLVGHLIFEHGAVCDP